MRKPLAVLVLIGSIVTACGDDGVSDDGATSGFPREIAGITLTEVPDRIISGSSTHTEILFAIGAGEQVIAVDAFSDYPAEAAELPRVDAFTPSVEGFAALEPDLVIITFDPNDLVAGLGALGIPVWVLDAPVDLEGVYAQITEIGDVTGNRDGAVAVIAEMRSQVAAVVAGLPQPLPEQTYYHELDDSYFSIGSDTFLGSIYGILGLTSIGDGAGGGYPQLSAEYIVEADPDFIFLADADCCGETPESVAARPGWEAMTAVTGGRVIPVDESLSSRWSPRIVDYLAAVAAEVFGGSP